MKSKTKILTTVLVCSALVLAFTACAGCTGTDPIVGTWVKSYSDGKLIYDMYSDNSFRIISVYDDGYVSYSTLKSWEKTGDNRYESGLTIFVIGEDGYSMNRIYNDGETDTFTKYSNYNVPAETPENSILYKEHQVTDTWKYGDYSDYMKLTLEAGNTGTIAIRSSSKGLQTYNINWAYYDTAESGLDTYTLTFTNNGKNAGVFGHMEDADQITYLAPSGTTTTTLTRI